MNKNSLVEEVTMISFGKNLKVLMAQKGISVQMLAKDLKISPRTANEWIGAGSRTPRDLMLIKRLAQYLDCSVHRLLYGEDEESVFEQLLTKTEIHTGLYEISVKKVKTK